MTGRLLYGIVPADGPLALEVTGADGQRQQVHAVRHQNLGAVVGPAAPQAYSHLSRPAALKHLVAYQVVVEAVMRQRTVLPVRFGTVLEDEGQVRRLLAEGAERFRQSLAAVAGKVQMEVIVAWDLDRVFADIAGEEEIVRERDRAAAAPVGEAVAQQTALGRRVKGCLERRRQALGTEIMALLRPVAQEIVAQPLLDDRIVAQLALLMATGQGEALERRLGELDARFAGRLTFRLVGPLPLYTFALVEVTVPSFSEVDRARRRLQLGRQVTLVDIRGAYRRLARAYHPDLNAESPSVDDFARLTQAHRLLVACWQSQQPGDGDPTRPCAFTRQAVEGSFFLTVPSSMPGRAEGGGR